jgi:hypothetical protein
LRQLNYHGRHQDGMGEIQVIDEENAYQNFLVDVRGKLVIELGNHGKDWGVLI